VASADQRSRSHPDKGWEFHFVEKIKVGCMAKMTPFRYGGYWDVPRYIIMRYRDRFLLLRSEFDKELDEYEANYTVFVLPESAGELVREGNWEFYNKTPMNEIGKIAVSAVVFDLTKRAELDASCLDELITKFEAA
jgi:hypothetical protein